jgi:hypothetical protein
LINANGFAAGITVLGEHAVEAGEAVWPPLPHDVPLAAQVLVALEAGKVLHVPGTALCLCALVREDDLGKKIFIFNSKFFVICAALRPCALVREDDKKKKFMFM